MLAWDLTSDLYSYCMSFCLLVPYNLAHTRVRSLQRAALITTSWQGAHSAGAGGGSAGSAGGRLARAGNLPAGEGGHDSGAAGVDCARQRRPRSSRDAQPHQGRHSGAQRPPAARHMQISWHTLLVTCTALRCWMCASDVMTLRQDRMNDSRGEDLLWRCRKS